MNLASCTQRHSFNHQARTLATWLKVKNHYLGNAMFIGRSDPYTSDYNFFPSFKAEDQVEAAG